MFLTKPSAARFLHIWRQTRKEGNRKMKYIKDGKMCTLPESAGLGAEQRLLRLEAEREIRDILHHYTRCVDRGDMEGIASCYTGDGCFYPSDRSDPIRGRQAILAVFAKLMDPNVKTSAHYITNQQVHFESESEATVFACFYANKSFAGGRADELTCGGYELRVLREEDGEWRIKSHKCFFTRQDGSLSGRFGEQKERPWPPFPEYRR